MLPLRDQNPWGNPAFRFVQICRVCAVFADAFLYLDTTSVTLVIGRSGSYRMLEGDKLIRTETELWIFVLRPSKQLLKSFR